MNAGNFTVERPFFDKDLLLIRTRVFDDDRGFFYESWSDEHFRSLGIPAFVQDNHSRSLKGVIRGLHWQGPPSSQGKLIRCTAGSICDIVVDIRGGSPTFGRVERIALHGCVTKREDSTGGDQTLLYVPPGFAHGFLALSDFTEVQYRVTAPWNRAAEGTLAWDDPAVRDLWPLDGMDPTLSDKDRQGLSLDQVRAKPPFQYKGKP